MSIFAQKPRIALSAAILISLVIVSGCSKKKQCRAWADGAQGVNRALLPYAVAVAAQTLPGGKKWEVALERAATDFEKLELTDERLRDEREKIVEDARTAIVAAQEMDRLDAQAAKEIEELIGGGRRVLSGAEWQKKKKADEINKAVGDTTKRIDDVATYCR